MRYLRNVQNAIAQPVTSRLRKSDILEAKWHLRDTRRTTDVHVLRLWGALPK